MKRVFCLMMVVQMLLPLCAVAENATLLCKGCTVNGLTALPFEGRTVFTAIADDVDAVLGWKIDGSVVEGEKSFYLVFTAEGNTLVETVYVQETPGEIEANATEAASKENEVKVSALGATLQYLNIDGIGSGDSYTEIDFTEDFTNPVTHRTCKGRLAAFKVTADRPHSSDIDYWVIDGIRYDFMYTVKAITVSNLRQSMTIEVVYKGKKSQTQLSNDEIQASRTGENLLVRSVNAKLALVKNTSTRIGGYVTSFDFTNDYKNPETYRMITGGSCNIKVVANVDSSMGEKVSYWKFDNVNMVLSANIPTFAVHGLNKSIVYTAVIGSKAPADDYYDDTDEEEWYGYDEYDPDDID